VHNQQETAAGDEGRRNKEEQTSGQRSTGNTVQRVKEFLTSSNAQFCPQWAPPQSTPAAKP